MGKYLLLILTLSFLGSAAAQDLEHPEWGFQGFDYSTVYHPTAMTGEAIQSAIDQASTDGGGTVVLDSGAVIEIGTDLSLKSNVRLLGAITQDSLPAVTIRASSQLGQAVIVARGTNNIVNTAVENIIIDGGGFDQHGLSFIYGTDNFLVSNCKIINIGLEKVPCYPESGRSGNPTAVNMWSDGNDYTSNFTIKGNYISSIGLHGINVNNGRNYILQNNYIEKCWMGWDASTGSDSAEVVGNEVVNCIFGAKTHAGTNLVIHDNNHHNLDDTPYYFEGWAYNGGTAFVFQGPGVTATVKNNRFSGTAADKGIAWWGQGQEGIVLENNDTAPSPSSAVKTAPKITTQPQSLAKEEGEQAVFSVVAVGTRPFSYRWYVNGNLISNKTESTYTTGTLTLSNNGDKYYCIVSNSIGKDTSEVATLSVTKGDRSVVLSTDKAVTFSYQENDGNRAASNIVDGIDNDEEVRWSAGAMPQWVEVDLGRKYLITKTELVCLQGRAYHFKVEIRDDGDSLMIVNRLDNKQPGTPESPITDKFEGVVGRYVRLTVTGAETYSGTWASILEFTILGDVGAIPEKGQAAYPWPIDGADDVSLNSEMSWVADSNAISHNVYFGTSNPPAFVGNQMDTVFVPDTLLGNTTYYWRVDEISAADTTEGMIWSFATLDPTSIEGEKCSNMPDKFFMGQNYPNPFNPTTKIEYALPRTVHVKINIYDIRGRLVKVLLDKIENAGYREVIFNGENLSSGIYFYHLQADNYSKIKRMLLIK